MPDCFRYYHKVHLSHYLQNGYTSNTNTSRLTYAIHNQGQLVQIKLYYQVHSINYNHHNYINNNLINNNNNNNSNNNNSNNNNNNYYNDMQFMAFLEKVDD